MSQLLFVLDLGLTNSDFCSYHRQIIVAISPLLALAYVLLMAFETEEAENKKRNKKTDFNLEGHGE